MATLNFEAKEDLRLSRVVWLAEDIRQDFDATGLSALAKQSSECEPGSNFVPGTTELA
jgi:hypothetical protein